MWIRGAMAEWLCSGLQSRVRRFDSGSRLHPSLSKKEILTAENPYRIDVLGDVLRLEVMGIPAPTGTDAVTSAFEAARKHGCTRILFDIRKANNPDFHHKVMRSAKRAIDLGIMDFRVALVDTPGSALLKFIDDVAANRSLPVRCYNDESEAMKWLKGAR